MDRNRNNQASPIPMGLILSLLMIAQTPSAFTLEDPFGWNDIPRSAYPGAFWMLMGSAVNSEELERNISALSEAGIRTLRMEALYPAKGSDVSPIQFLSEEWNRTAKEAIEIARSHGAVLDLWGNGWPFGGPWIQPEHASRRLEWDNGWAAVVLSETKTLTQDNGYPIFSVSFSEPGRPETAKVIRQEVGPDGAPVWEIPPGQWDVFIFRNGYTRMQVKRATTGGEGPVLDHFSLNALEDYLKPYNRLMEVVGRGGFEVTHEDSYEVYGANWTGDLPSFFRERRGYDIAPYLPLMISSSTSDLARRIRHDYRQTVEELLVEVHIKPWMEWARGWGMRTSLQAQGCPGHLVDLYGLADQPDPEAFGREGMASDGLDRRNGGYLCSKFASSGAHLNGRKLVSSETFTWLEDHFQSSLDRMRNDLDYYFLAGINHIYFHTCTYSPADVPFPGWLYYASVHMDPCQPWWRHVPQFTDYIARVQTVLQHGAPGEDVLLLYPIHDLWLDDRGSKDFLQYCQVHNFTNWMTEVAKPTHQAAVWLWEKGWKFDWCSDRTIRDQMRMEDGQIVCGDGRYRALIIPECGWLGEKTPGSIRRLAENGATVLVVGEAPQAVPTGPPSDALPNDSPEERRARLTLSASGQGSGQVIYLDSIETLADPLARAGCRRERMADSGILSIRRRFGDQTAYFIKNAGDKTFDGFLPLGTEGSAVLVGDPVQGRWGRTETRPCEGGLEARVRLLPTETRLLMTGGGSAAPWADPTVALDGRRSLDITGPWRISWRDSEKDGVQTKTLDSLLSWTEIPELTLFSGTVAYESGFEVPQAPQEGERYFLDLGQVRHSADVFLNEEQVACLWTTPFQVEVTGHLKEGGNVLRLEVINLLANRIIGLERSGVHIADRHLFVNYAYKPFDAAQWNPLPSGLLGPVRVVMRPADGP
ncbi:MAG: hypothetical protein HUU16_06050 [Candidatus Omnitrophica bacterium]|nr:hypothetical protein [Candidatus Omnitrophota bacterium]